MSHNSSNVDHKSLDPTALSALVIAVVALVVAVFQLLAQAVGTVEGYRHCQKSVIGGWSKGRRRDWSWTQFRYDTLFITPDIVLGPVCHAPPNLIPLHEAHQPDVLTYRDISGEKRKFPNPFAPDQNRQEGKRGTDLVCWITLLNTLHETPKLVADVIFENEHRRKAWRQHPDLSWACIRIKERSWDLMPPGVVRPFATTNLNDIAILACRIGVEWKDFRPNEGIMEGDGNGHVLSANKIRGLGLMVTYTMLVIDEGYQTLLPDELTEARESDVEARVATRNAAPEHMGRRLTQQLTFRYIWSPAADKFWFGILHGDQDLVSRDFQIGTMSEVFDTLWQIDDTGKAVRSLETTQAKQKNYMHGFCDIIPVVAPWLRPPRSRLNCYPRPLRGTKGLALYNAAKQMFRKMLGKYQETIERTIWVADRYDDLHKRWPMYWDEWRGEDPDLDFIDRIQELFYETTRFFKALPQQVPTFHYMDLITAHLREAPRSYVDALANIDNEEMKSLVRDIRFPPRDDRWGGHARWRAHAMVWYWKYMPDYVSYMESRGCREQDAVHIEEAWIVMIFRAFLWTNAHEAIENVPMIPSRYYGSRLPIFIG